MKAGPVAYTLGPPINTWFLVTKYWIDPMDFPCRSCNISSRKVTDLQAQGPHLMWWSRRVWDRWRPKVSRHSNDATQDETATSVPDSNSAPLEQACGRKGIFGSEVLAIMSSRKQ